MNNNNYNFKKSKKGNKIFGYLTILVILIGAPLACVIYVSLLKKDKTISDWNPNVTDNEKIKRTLDRGTIISIILMLSSLVQATLKGFGASSTMLLLLYGFFMASVLGFMGDQGYGTDEGFSLKDIGSYKKKAINGLGAQLKYIFGTLTMSSFWRFIITVFLDMFISAPIQSVIVAVFNPHIEILRNTISSLPNIMGVLLNFVIKNFDNVLQSFVAFITFLAYANDTRFRWAYAGSDINPNLLISTSVIKISTAIAGVVYLIANISADFNIVDGAKIKVGTSLVDRLDRKMWFVLIMIGLLTLGSLNENSFLNKKNNRYDIKPLVNMTDDAIWHIDTALNFFYKEQMKELLPEDKLKEICNKKTNYWDTCEVDPKTGNLILEPNEEAKNNSLKYILNEKKKIIEQYFIKTDDQKNPIIDTNTNAFIKVPETEVNKIKLLDYIKGKDWDSNKPCFIPDHAFLCNCSEYDTKSFGENSYSDYLNPDYKNKFCSDKEKYINSKNFESDEFKSKKAELQKILSKAEKEYEKEVKKNGPNANELKIKRDNANTALKQYLYRQQLNENNGKLVKKIDMGLYRTHNSRLEDKFDIINKSNTGFGIFCLYLLIGVVVPFIPIKFIYGNELKEKGRVFKLIIVFIVVYGIAGVLYFISMKSPDTDTLIQNERDILNANKN